MTGWQPIKSVPDRVQVLLLWAYDDNVSIIRIGEMLHKPYGDENPWFKLELDYGDAHSVIYTDRDDCPTHWMPLPEYPT